MGFMSPDFTRYFKDLPDGRSVFYPNGPAGRGYQISDWRRERIERRLRFAYFLNIALAVGVTQAVLHAPGGWWWCVAILVPPAIQWRLMRSAAEGLNESDETYTHAEASKRQLEAQSWGTLLALLAFSALMIVGGAWMVDDGPPWRLPGAGALGIGALCAAASVWQIRRKRQLEDDKHHIPRSRTPRWL